jgi:hypothetical protein
MVTGKEGNQIIRAYTNVRFYKTDISGKCDSIHSSSRTALTKLIGNLYYGTRESQITGDLMHLIGNNATQELDSPRLITPFWSQRHLRNRIQSGKGKISTEV